MAALVVVISLLVAIPGAAAAIHLTVLAVAALFYREPKGKRAANRNRFCILIPAHNEEAVLGKTLTAIRKDCRPEDLIFVVADRCTDATAEIARTHGALVLDLPEAGVQPGRAQARQSGVDAAMRYEWDAIVMIDADSIIDPGFFDAAERMLGLGALALQARSEASLGTGLVTQAYVASFALHGVTVARGRDRLGLSVRLRGSGMVLTRAVARRYRFRAPASEDLWYSLDLCLDGILPRHLESARLRSESVKSWGAASNQRVRYEAGRMSAAREYFVRLLRCHTWASLEAAVYIATPPFAIASALLLISAAALMLVGTPLVLPILAFLGLLVFDLGVGLAQARAGLATWLALLAAPLYISWKAWVQVRALISVGRRDAQYGPTPRGYDSR